MHTRASWAKYLTLAVLGATLLSAVVLSVLNVQSVLNRKSRAQTPAVRQLELYPGTPTVRLQFPDGVPLEAIIQQVTGGRKQRFLALGGMEGFTDARGNFKDCSLTRGELSAKGCGEDFESENDLTEVPGLLALYDRGYLNFSEPIPGAAGEKPIHDSLGILFMKFDSARAAQHYLKIAPKGRPRFVRKSPFIFEGLEVFVDQQWKYVWYIQSGPYLLEIIGSYIAGEMGDLGRTFLQKMIAIYGSPS